MHAVKNLKILIVFLNIRIYLRQKLIFFKYSNLAHEIHFVFLEEIKCKCFRMPLQPKNIIYCVEIYMRG